MRRLLVLGLTLALSATGAWADRYDDCAQDKDRDRQIRGCTQIIERGEKETRKTRAIAYYNRGVGYGKKRDHDRAIADFDKATALNPKLFQAYNNRGIVYVLKGDKEQAIADFRKVLEIDPSLQKTKNWLKKLGVTPEAG